MTTQHTAAIDDTRQVPLTELYRQMVAIRMFDERVLELRLEGLIHGTVHPYVGEEAIAVGVAAALRPGDQVVSHHRGHGHCLAMGAAPDRMMAELFGREDGYCRGRGGSMHVVDLEHGVLGANGIVGAGLSIATGAAFAAQWSGDGRVIVAFFGDGATGQGTFHESLNLAALWGLPIVFVCENNRYAVETPISEALARDDIAGFATQYAMPGEVLDGGDVLAVREAATAAIARARSGEGPSLLECQANRWRIHAQRGVPIPDRRAADELELAREADPIRLLGERMVTTGVATADDLRAIEGSEAEQLRYAIAFASDSPFPDPATVMEARDADD
jgi:TPP-dependent pyruvate/acetoin dehydrogenase alpha subunit